MRNFLPLLGAAITLALVGCDAMERARLEKENAELKEAAKKRAVVEEYDFQSKCSADGRKMFDDWIAVQKGYKPEPLIDYKSHYNRASNKCLVLISRLLAEKGSDDEDVTLMNVYENSADGEYWEHNEKHYIDKPLHRLYSCHVFDKKCGSREEFDILLKPYMTE